MKDALIDFVADEILNGRSDVKLTADDNLLESGLVDSIGIMRVIQFVEQEFDVPVPPEDVTIENFMTIQAICSYLAERTAT